MRKKISFIIALIMVMVFCFGVTGCSDGGKTKVILLNWGEYLDPDILKEFNEMQDEFEVVEKKVTSNEEMYAILSTEGHGYDMCVPSEYMAEQMWDEGMLAEINTQNIANYKYVQEYSESRSFDPTSKYSIPYMCGTVGIVYNTKMVDEEVTSWDILWDEKYTGNVIMYKSVRDSMLVALMRLGYDMNTTNPDEIEEAMNMLIEQKSIVLAYGTDEIKETMISGSCALAVDYSGAAVEAISINPDLDYVVPEEGSNIWVDNLVIMKDSKHKEYCEEFISYLCDPEIMARNAEYIGYSVPSEEALALIDPEWSSIPGYIITDEERGRCEYYRNIGDNLELYFDAWTRVVTADWE